MKIAINGMGRIGRLLCRRLLQEGFEVVAVNDVMDPDNLVYLLKYDSLYGPTDDCSRAGEHLLLQGHRLRLLQEADPLKLPWQELGVELVLECTGQFNSSEKASRHLQAGAARVLLSTTGTPEVPLAIYGTSEWPAPGTRILSPGGCMTNCLAPLIHLLQSFDAASIQVNVIHSYTSRQNLVDGPASQFRRGRAAAESIIPVEVDLAESLERLFPALATRISTLTTRVPVPNGALADISAELHKPVNAAALNETLRAAAAGRWKNILQYTEEGIVSLDVKGNSHSAVIDGSLTSVINGHARLYAFFDNEWGYTSRMIDWIRYWS